MPQHPSIGRIACALAVYFGWLAWPQHAPAQPDRPPLPQWLAPLWQECHECTLFDGRLDCLRDRTLWHDWTCSAGGELRYRYMDEHNRLRPNGTTHTTYDLWRFAPFVEVANELVTGHVRAIDASIFDSEIAPVPIDRNRADLLLYYVDASLWEPEDGELRLRLGRQFLQYGSQRFISPLPWGNTYRNFEGARLYWASTLWDVEAFLVRPVNGAAVATQFRPTSRDRPDASVTFSGIYVSRKQLGGGALDGYWYWNREDDPLPAHHDGNRHTLGLRYWGTKALDQVPSIPARWLWDVEGGWQFGTDNFGTPGVGRDVSAGFGVATGEVTLTDTPWTPALTGVFWWGSGDGTPGTGTINTLATLYPFGHAYWGLLDNFNGSNLLQYSAQLRVKPLEKWTLLSAWHWFDKARSRDFIYNIAGAPQGGPTGGRHIGQELDLITTYAIGPGLELQLGYSWFWYGAAVNAQPALRRGDAHQAYLMTTWAF